MATNQKNKSISAKQISFLCLLILLYTSPSNATVYKQVVDTNFIKKNLPKHWPEDGLIVFPQAGRRPWLDAIRLAKTHLRIAAYKLSDPTIVDAIICAKKANPKLVVDILIQPHTFIHQQSKNNDSAIESLKKNGINVHLPSERFNQAHYKLIIVDGVWAAVGTINLDDESFDGIPYNGVPPARDFMITVTDADLVAELVNVFTADANDKRIVPKQPQLVWGPDRQRSVFINMINSAKKSIHIYQQDLQDRGITRALLGACHDKINVSIMMMPFPYNKMSDGNIPNQAILAQAGGKIFLNKSLYMHAKVMIIDGHDEKNRLMYVGSCNFYPDSLDQSRELGVLTTNADQIQKVLDIFETDIKGSKVFMD